MNDILLSKWLEELGIRYFNAKNKTLEDVETLEYVTRFEKSTETMTRDELTYALTAIIETHKNRRRDLVDLFQQYARAEYIKNCLCEKYSFVLGENHE